MLSQRFRPITVLPVLQKLWSSLLLNCIKHTLQPQIHDGQFAFRSGFEINRAIHLVRCIGEKIAEWDQEFFMLNLSIRKAFDRVLRRKVAERPLASGLPADIVRVTDEYMEVYTTYVLDSSVRTDPVPLHRGVRQGCPMSPLFFILALDEALRACNGRFQDQRYGVQLGNLLISYIAFAGDIALIAASEQDLEVMATQLQEALQPLGLEISWDKCGACSNQADLPRPLTIHGNIIPFVPKEQGMKFLGCFHTMDGKTHTDFEHRMGLARQSFHARGEIWSGLAETQT